MKTFLLCAAALTVFLAPAARAEFTFDVAEVGSNVVVTGSGTIDLTDLTQDATANSQGSFLIPSEPFGPTLLIAPNGSSYTEYRFATGPASWGSGGMTNSTTASGDAVGIIGAYILDVPAQYVSGAELSDTMTFGKATFATLGIDPGTYTYTWGSGDHADSLVVEVVPEPGTWALVGMGAAGLGIVGSRRRRLVGSLLVR